MEALEEVKSELRSAKTVESSSPLWPRIVGLVEQCNLPPLSKPRDEYSECFTDEYACFFADVVAKLEGLTDVLRLLKGKMGEGAGRDATVLATFTLLLTELKPNTPWTRNTGYSEYYEHLNAQLKEVLDVNVFKKFPTTPPYENLPDGIFVVAMEKLHMKLTKDMWKRQPGALQSYRFMLKEWTLIHKIKCPLPLIFPCIFLQLDDYECINKIEGFKCCHSAFKNMVAVEGEKNGYETVIYDALTRYLQHSELSVITGALQCIILLLPMMGATELNGQWNHIDDVLETVLEALAFDVAGEKKKVYWKYLIQLMNLNGNCAIRWKKKILLLIMEAIKIGLSETNYKYETATEYLKCLDCWLKIGWPIWHFESDKKLIVLMLLIIYRRREYNETNIEVQNLMLMLALCSEAERKEVLSEEHVKLDTLPADFQAIWIEKLKLKHT